MELDHISAWAAGCNLRLNLAKTREMVVFRRGVRAVPMPPPILGVLRVTSMNILGVTFSDSLSVSSHIDTIVSKCSQNMYALKILRAHGLSGPSLHMVCRSMLDNRISYAAPSWSGFASAA